VIKVNYAEEFKELWENMRFVEARDLHNEWLQKDPLDINCQYAIIIINGLAGSIPYSQLKGHLQKINSVSNGGGLTDWYRYWAEIALEKHPNKI
jgi:hypothetical protein